MKQWLCLKAQPTKEIVTAKMLRDLGLNAFTPIHQKEVKVGRGTRKVSRPLLGSGYVFVEGHELPLLQMIKLSWLIKGYVGDFHEYFGAYLPRVFLTDELKDLFADLVVDKNNESYIIAPILIKTLVTIKGHRAILMEIRGGKALVKLLHSGSYLVDITDIDGPNSGASIVGN